MLRGVTTLTRDVNARVLWNQRIHEIHAHRWAVVVEIGKLMTPGCAGRDVCRCAQANRSYAGVHVASVRELAVDQGERRRSSVHGEDDRAEHLPRVGIAFGAGDLSVAIRIYPGDHLSRHIDPRGQIDFQAHAIDVDRQSSRLQVFIESMRASRNLACQHDAENREKSRRCTFIASRVWRRSRWSGRDRSCECAPGPLAAARTR